MFSVMVHFQAIVCSAVVRLRAIFFVMNSKFMVIDCWTYIGSALYECWVNYVSKQVVSKQ